MEYPTSRQNDASLAGFGKYRSKDRRRSRKWGRHPFAARIVDQRGQEFPAVSFQWVGDSVGVSNGARTA